MSTTNPPKSAFRKKKVLKLGLEQSLTAHLTSRAEASGGFACWMYGGYWMSSLSWVLTEIEGPVDDEDGPYIDTSFAFGKIAEQVRASAGDKGFYTVGNCAPADGVLPSIPLKKSKPGETLLVYLTSVEGMLMNFRRGASALDKFKARQA